jgi:hypothetical protein
MFVGGVSGAGWERTFEQRNAHWLAALAACDLGRLSRLART